MWRHWNAAVRSEQIVQLTALPEAFWWMVGTVGVLKFGPLAMSLEVEETQEAEFQSLADPEESAEADPYGGIGKPM